MINKNQSIAPKQGVNPISPFTISDPSRVMRTHNQTELTKQHTGMHQNGDAPVLLLSLLKDPAVAVSYLKNIFMLEELFKLLPANNKTVTPEIEQIFQSLIMHPGDIKKELLKQENASTLFKGELFDFLRKISNSQRSTASVQRAIATLLKSLNNVTNKNDILDAVANSLAFLETSLASNEALSSRLSALIASYRKKNAGDRFYQLKEQTLTIVKDVENSLLFSPKISKVLSIIVYNLSRYNDSSSFFNESSYRLRQMLGPQDQKKFIQLINQYSKDLQAGVFKNQLQTSGDVDSTVMDALIKLVNNQSANDDINSAEAASIDKILHSLLSSPCNFTPLLHFIIPVVYEDIKAFAEVWINPESDEKDMPGDVESGKHFLLVIDIDHIGRFEAELFTHDNIVDFYLFCPPGYPEKFEEMMARLPKVLSNLNFKLGETKLSRLDNGRSLMEVFKSLPYRRVGVDVKI